MEIMCSAFLCGKGSHSISLSRLGHRGAHFVGGQKIAAIQCIYFLRKVGIDQHEFSTFSMARLGSARRPLKTEIQCLIKIACGGDTWTLTLILRLRLIGLKRDLNLIGNSDL